MGYPNVVDFDVEIMKRTYMNIENRNITNTFTHILNSMMGMFVLPIEIDKKNERKKYISKINEYELFCAKKDKKENVTVGNKEYEIDVVSIKSKTFDEISIFDIMYGLRNSIAHQNVRPVKSSNESWEGVIFRNYTDGKNNKQWNDEWKFQIYLTESELKDFMKIVLDLTIAST